MKRTIITVILTLAFTAFAIQAVEQTAFSGAGIIHSTTGGFKFPDGSIQLSAITPPCTAITYLPFVILDEGVYCFTDHLETSITSGHAITIEADNVVIDLNGWKLDGLAAGTATTADGIYAYQRKNITIKNGTVDGFLTAIYLRDDPPLTASQGHVIEDIRADKNTMRGISVFGRDYVIRRNQVIDTGGTSHIGYIVGIYVVGPSGHVLNNDISKTTGGTVNQTKALFLNDAHGTLVAGNRIDDVSGDTGVNEGIHIQLSNDVLVRGNSITNVPSGISYLSSTGKYMDNLTSGVTTPFTGGTPIGIND
jgi:hypothetical protein